MVLSFSLNTTYSAIMKSFFEGHQASFVSVSCKVERARKCQKEAKGGFPVMAETTRNHIFSKEISQVIIAAMVLAPNFY